MDRTTRIQWREPYRETLQASLTETRAQGLLRPWFWARIVLISTGVTGLLIAATMLAYPGIWLPWPQIILGLLITPAMFALAMGLSMLAPRYVEARADWIQFTTTVASRIQARDIRSVTVTQDGHGTLRLTVSYSGKRGTPLTKSCVVSAEVNREELESLVAHLAQRAPGGTDGSPCH